MLHLFVHLLYLLVFCHTVTWTDCRLGTMGTAIEGVTVEEGTQVLDACLAVGIKVVGECKTLDL